MGKSERRKGQVGEREVVKLLQGHGFESRRTAPLQTDGLVSGAADVDGLPGFHIEVKRQERWSPKAWYQQAEQDAPLGAIPVVFMRESRGDWLVMIDANDFLDVITGEKP